MGMGKMTTATKILSLAIVIVVGAILNNYTPNEFKYALGVTIGTFIQTIIWL